MNRERVIRFKSREAWYRFDVLSRSENAILQGFSAVAVCFWCKLHLLSSKQTEIQQNPLSNGVRESTRDTKPVPCACTLKYVDLQQSTDE